MNEIEKKKLKICVIMEKIDTLVCNEIDNQFDKFGVQNHNFEHWYLILMEEIGEIAKEYLEFQFEINKYKKRYFDDLYSVKNEIIQSIALLIQIYSFLEEKTYR